jgi:RHS repeat-associated protein
VTTDRMGSVRSGGPGGRGYQAQYPYGVEYTTTANDREKYATYTRDSLTGLDYAMNRYYASQWGRFLSPDPYAGSISLASPQSRNRYTYVGGDPVNGNDPAGLYLPAPPPVGPVWGYNPFPPGSGLGGPGGGVGGGSGGGDGPTPCVLAVPRVGMDPFFHPCDPGGGGGGGGVSTTQQVISAAEKLAEQWLKKQSCSQLFGNGFNPATVLQALASSGKFTSGFTQMTMTFASFGSSALDGLTLPTENPAAFGIGMPGSAFMLGLGAAIFINTSAFSGYGSDAAAETAVSLIHELGHAYNFIPLSCGSSIVPDGLLAGNVPFGNTTVSPSLYNDLLVEKDCNQ